MNAEALPAARTLLAGLDLIPLTSDLVEAATDAGEPLHHTPGAVHLVSATSIGPDLSAFVVYDRRLHTPPPLTLVSNRRAPGSGDG